jgi:nucleoside-diphosphate-sugar epimerase
VDEDIALRLISEYPPAVYATLKLAGEWLGNCYRAEYGVDVVSVRFGGVIGPWYGTPSGGPSQLVQKLVEGGYRGETVQVPAGAVNSGKSAYVYASDAAQGTVRAIHAENPASHVYNISMERLYGVQEIVDLVQEFSGRELKLDVIQAKSTSGYDKPVLPVDLTRAKTELGWKEEFPMDVAVQDYIAWLQRQTPAGAAR